MDSLEDIWQQILAVVAKDITPTAYNTWFSDCTAVDITERKLVIHTTSDFKRGIISGRFSEIIRGVLYDLFSCEFDLDILAGDELLEYEKSANKKPSPYPEMEGYTFDNFVVGPLEQVRPRGPPSPSRTAPGRSITRSSYTATPASARRTCCWP